MGAAVAVLVGEGGSGGCGWMDWMDVSGWAPRFVFVVGSCCVRGGKLTRTAHSIHTQSPKK